MTGEVLAFDPADGSRQTRARIEGLPFSIDRLPDGRLVSTTPDGVVIGEDLAPCGARGRGWNEIVVDPRGRGGRRGTNAASWEA